MVKKILLNQSIITFGFFGAYTTRNENNLGFIIFES